MSWGTFWWSIITPKKSQRPLREKENVFKSQREFKVKTKKLPKARENAGDQVAIGLSFPFDWLPERVARVFWTDHWAKYSNINEISDYLGHSIEYCSSTQISNWKLLPSNTHDHDGHLFLQFQPQGGLKTIDRDENVLMFWDNFNFMHGNFVSRWVLYTTSQSFSSITSINRDQWIITINLWGN